MPRHADISKYNKDQEPERRAICERLAAIIEAGLPHTTTNKVWHRHPVWFDADNPVVGYAAAKVGVRVLFWSGRSFDEPELAPEGSFQAAEIRYRNVADIDEEKFGRWLAKAIEIQWDYKNIVKRRGKLERLK